jgi:hypothetical protein
MALLKWLSSKGLLFIVANCNFILTDRGEDLAFSPLCFFCLRKIARLLFFLMIFFTNFAFRWAGVGPCNFLNVI